MFLGGKMTVEFSVIIPAKNEAENIHRCLASLKTLHDCQDNFEVIVVDNGSTDRTPEISREFGAIVFSKPDYTIAALRNYGVTQSTGRIIAFLDADCTVAEDWLLKAKVWCERKDIVCFGSAPAVPTDATWVQNVWFQCVRKKQSVCEEVSWLESMNMFVRRDIFERVGGFDESLATCEDVDLSYRLSQYGKIMSDQTIQAIHHGEARTLCHFFLKERWRGKSNFVGVKAHGVVLKELPSIFLPTLYVAGLIAVVVGSIAGYWMVSLGFMLFMEICLVGLSFYTSLGRCTLLDKLGLAILLNIYFLARGVAWVGK